MNQVDIYILQNVLGDAGDGTGRYTLSSDGTCGIPGDLPPGLKQRTSGGIMTIEAVTVVELREGYHNITGAVLPVDSVPQFDPKKRYALNDEADECVMEATVSAMPSICSAETNPVSANMVSGVDSKNRAILRFDISCEADIGDDDAADDMGDMGGADDDAADTSDDTGDGDDDAMGPPEDVATG